MYKASKTLFIAFLVIQSNFASQGFFTDINDAAIERLTDLFYSKIDFCIEGDRASFRNKITNNIRPFRPSAFELKLVKVIINKRNNFLPSDVDLLIQVGTNINAVDHIDITPLYIACKFNPVIVPNLLNYGANPKALTTHGSSPLDVLNQHHKEKDFYNEIYEILVNAMNNDL